MNQDLEVTLPIELRQAKLLVESGIVGLDPVKDVARIQALRSAADLLSRLSEESKAYFNEVLDRRRQARLRVPSLKLTSTRRKRR